MTTSEPAPNYFEPDAWQERYAGTGKTWSGKANPQLVTEVTPLNPGTALDVGCGEGGDVLWLAAQGWTVTGADFSSAGLARAAAAAAEAGLAERCDFIEVDARTFDPEGRTWDLVTTHFLHPADGGMSDVVARLARAVAPSGHLLVVGHAPTHDHTQEIPAEHQRAMFFARDLLPALPDDFTVVVEEQRPRTVVRDGKEMLIEDSTLLARRSG